eukprot:574786-Pleurochrysis_carterae.AAC.2
MRFLVYVAGDCMFGFAAHEDGGSPPTRALLALSARAALLDALMLPVKVLDACAPRFLVATANQAAVVVAPVAAHTDISHQPHVVKGGCALWVTLAMLAGTPYHQPTSLAASKLRS